MAQTAVPRIRSGFESATQGLEPVALSNDEDDDEYIPESLRLFVAQAEMKQESVLSLLSNEMSGEEIEKTISEDSETTIIDRPPSSSANSGDHYPKIGERPGPRWDETAHSKIRARKTKRSEERGNASHLRRLLGSSASKPMQVQQRPTRRRPLSNPVDSVGSRSTNSSTSSVHDLIVQPESSPANCSSCQTTSMEDLKRRLYSPLLPENKLSSASDDCMTGRTKPPEPDSMAPRDVLPLVKLSENPDLSMETFEEDEVPESLRFLFEQADQALRQTQQEFLEVAGGYHDSTSQIEDSGSATKLATEIKRMSPSLCDDKSVEFPLSLYAVGVVTGGSDCEAPPALEEVQLRHESTETPSNAHFEGVQKISDLEPAVELEPILVPVSRCNSEMNVRGLEPWEPANELEPILVPLSLCEAQTYPDDETFKPYRIAQHTEGERGQDALDCEPVVSAPVNRIDSQRDEKDETSAGSPLECPQSSASSRSLNLARLEVIREPVTTQSTWTCVESGARAATSKGVFSDTLGDASTQLHLKSNEYMLVQEVRACIGTNPEPDLLSNFPHQEPEVAGNASSNRTEVVNAARHSQTPSPPSADGCATKSISPRYGAHSYSDFEEARSPPEGCVAPESIPGRLSPLSGFEAAKKVARSMVSNLKESSFDRSCDIVEGAKPTGNTSSLGLLLAEPHNHNDPKNDKGALSSSTVGDKDATSDKRVNDTAASTRNLIMMRACETYPPSPPAQSSDKIFSYGSGIETPLLRVPFSGVPSADELLPKVTSISRPQAPELQRICSGNGEVPQLPNSPIGGQFSPGPSDDNQSANFMPFCCSPAHASSNGTKEQLPEAQESESDESSIRNPPSIVQVPSPAPMQILRSPDSAAQVAPCKGDANALSPESTGRATVPCGELIAVNRVSSTLTVSYSDDNQSIHDESKNSPHAQRPIETIREEMQGRELINQDRVSQSCGEGGLQLIETKHVSANDKASAFCGDAPLFGAFAIPKSILSFVALADEMIEQQQSRFVCCSQDQFASVASDDHAQPNTVESTTSDVLKKHHSLERKDSLWNMFNGSGSSDPIPVIPVEAVLKCSRRGSSFERSKNMFDVSVEDKMVSQNENMSGSIESLRTSLVNDVQLDGRTVRDECTNDEDVVEVELDCAAHLSKCVTRSEEAEPSVSPPPHCQPTFDSPSIQSLESSHGWTENAADDGCAVPPVDAQLDGRMVRKECTNDEDVVEVDLDCVAHLSNCVTRSEEAKPSASPPPHCQPSFDSPSVQSLESSHGWTENAAEDSCAVPPVDAPLDERLVRNECSNDEDVVETELDCVGHLSNCVTVTISQEREPSASPPPHFQPSFDSPSVQSLESSHGWTENAADDGCAVPPVVALDCKRDPRFATFESTVGVKDSPGSESNTIPADSAYIVANLLVPISNRHDIAETSDEALARCDGEHSGQLTMDNEPPAGLLNPSILKQNVSGASPSACENFLTVLLAEEFNIEALSSDFWEHSVASTVPALDTMDLPLGDGLTDEIDKSDHGPILESEPLLGLPSGSDKIQGTQLSESTPNGVDCPLGTVVAEDNTVANTPDLETTRQNQEHPAKPPIVDTLESRINPEKSSSYLGDATSEPKRLVAHSPRNWRSSSQKLAEEARAKAIERIRQRKHKEKHSLVVESQEPGGVKLKAKRQQYSAKEGVARAIQRMKAFRKAEQANAAERKNSSTTNSSRIEGSSQSRRLALQAHHVVSGGHHAPTIDSKMFTVSVNTLPGGEFRNSKKENERYNHRRQERPRRSFIPAPRVTKDCVVCPRGADCPTRLSQKLMAARSLDDFQCEPLSVGETTATVDLQSAMSFPSYMRPTKSSLAPAFRGSNIDPWLLSTSDVRVSLATSSRVLQSMLRSEHPVAMNTGLWKWYVRPLPPRAKATRSIGN